MKKKVIITGSSGFIGSALTERLKKKYKVIGIDKINRNISSDIKFYQKDINFDLPDIKDVYAVIHLAARPGVRNSHELFDEVCKDNILGTQRIIKKCIENWKPKRLLIASSSSVYGDKGRGGLELEEYESLSPRSPYAMSKCANEYLISTYKNCGMLKDIECTSMRFFTVYGPHQRNELAIRAFTDWILKDQPIILYGDGKQKRDFTHIDDICSAIEILISTNKILYSAYNIGSNESHSINEIICYIAKITGKKVTIDYRPRDIYDVDETLADINRMKELGWSPKINFYEGLRGQIEWQKTLIKK